jgi:hypothetical protein
MSKKLFAGLFWLLVSDSCILLEIGFYTDSSINVFTRLVPDGKILGGLFYL